MRARCRARSDGLRPSRRQGAPSDSGGGETSRDGSGGRRTLQARAILGCHDVKPIEDPIRELAALGGEILDLKDILAAKVAELRDWTTSDSFDREGIKAVLGAYERALERCQRLLVDMAKLDLDTRLVRLSEAQADMLERVIEVVLALPELGLSKGQRKIAREGVVRELPTLAAAGA